MGLYRTKHEQVIGYDRKREASLLFQLVSAFVRPYLPSGD